ncbi:hypothetical protein ACJ2CR_26530 [Myxococcus faecalis]|uniref:hypothetical protein n=1 Tax=Myxococcus faecalis TaxID=3115646 RepID=UPI0038CF6BA5
MRAIHPLMWSLGLAACGGAVAPLEDASSGPQQQDSALVESCEAFAGTPCRPGGPDFICLWSHGPEGWCYCRPEPLNTWTCEGA